MGSDSPDSLDYAGDFNLNAIILQSHQGDGYDSASKKRVAGGVNILSLVTELNIYESIDKAAVTGSLVVTDAQNLIGNLPIQGTERIMFKLSTPGTDKPEHIIDASELTGHPFYVYKISDRREIKSGTLLYIIHFGSREFMRNLRVKVSKAYSGKIDLIVRKILSDKDGLDTRKKVYFQPTRNSDKIVIPNLPPFQAVSLLTRRALPENSEASGYYFYETTKGYNFRSWESMCAHYGRIQRDPVQKFHYSKRNMTNDTITENKDTEKMDTSDQRLFEQQSVESYRIVNNFHDTAANTALGTYGHRVITHNLFSKSYTTNDYHYHNQYARTVHTDFHQNESSDNKFVVVDTPVDFDQRGVSDYPESRVSLVPTTQFLHNEETGNYGVDVSQDGVLDGIRIAQRNQITASTTIELTVKGQTFIQPGDVVLFDLRPVEKDGITAGRKPYDLQYSGRYIVCSIRHKVDANSYKMILVIKKDSVREPFLKGEPVFQGEPLREHPEFETVGSRNRPPGIG